MVLLPLLPHPNPALKPALTVTVTLTIIEVPLPHVPNLGGRAAHVWLGVEQSEREHRSARLEPERAGLLGLPRHARDRSHQHADRRGQGQQLRRGWRVALPASERDGGADSLRRLVDPLLSAQAGALTTLAHIKREAATYLRESTLAEQSNDISCFARDNFHGTRVIASS